MSEVDDLLKELNYEFNKREFTIKCYINNLTSPVDRSLASAWLKKLAKSNSSLKEMSLRNDLARQLAKIVQVEKRLMPPFTMFPPVGPLQPCLCPSTTPVACPAATPAQKRSKPLLHKISRDGGAFLCGQPIPPCGVFCYVAVVGDEDNADTD
ncbi:uncharacterized protein LOC126474824 [Schistocerca serialis cubense]|uniref:uncharacterized protein LOC126474824 n=1 Tax=Schistocerca serialis cubense TaxID=2023355 RepID=UPI00214F0055|nr:uncharacterized protein LOC126474824 [Schistocerca serialis cubense]